MKIALLCSNTVPIDEHTKKGTEIFVKIFSSYLSEYKDFSFTIFASADSQLPVTIESFGIGARIHDTTAPVEKHIIFELASLSKAFALQEAFDLYHVHIGDGDIVLPFARFINKPILITMHHVYDLPYLKEYMSLFSDCKNVFYISISNAQRNLLPDLPYVKTIYHGIEVEQFAFSKYGGENLLWAGRGIPSKGLDIVFQVAERVKKDLTACIIRKPFHQHWLDNVLHGVKDAVDAKRFTLHFDVKRGNLIKEYQNSKAFLFPLQWEEPFGLVMIESMAVGTPVIAFAKGAAPEIIKDGETGFLVNSSDDDIRGNFIIKKTGIAGLVEAVERIYSLSDTQYHEMRYACRKHVEDRFSAKRMVNEYIELYKTFR